MNWDIERKFAEIATNLFQKVEKYEFNYAMDTLRHRLDSLEHSLREICAENDGLRARVQELETR